MSERPGSNVKLVSVLSVLVVGMFAFGYALGPLYDVLCAVTGIGGKTGVISEERAMQSKVAEDRTVTVQFVGTVTAGLPWKFIPTVHSVKVRPGEAVDASFIATNNSSRRVVGQAVPSVAPQEAARHFKKTECFCFVQQALESGEEKEMPVRFLVDAYLPDHVNTITLSYAFFNADEFAPDEGLDESMNKKSRAKAIFGSGATSGTDHNAVPSAAAVNASIKTQSRRTDEIAESGRI